MLYCYKGAGPKLWRFSEENINIQNSIFYVIWQDIWFLLNIQRRWQRHKKTVVVILNFNRLIRIKDNFYNSNYYFYLKNDKNRSLDQLVPFLIKKYQFPMSGSRIHASVGYRGSNIYSKRINRKIEYLCQQNRYFYLQKVWESDTSRFSPHLQVEIPFLFAEI